MGFDTTIIINNDMLSEIERDQNFGKMVAEAIKALPASEGPVPIGNGAYAIESHHMDGITVVAVGGRKGQILGGCAYTANHQGIIHALAQKHELTLVDNNYLAELNKKPSLAELREWADTLGYRLVKGIEPDEPETRAEQSKLDRAIAGLQHTRAVNEKNLPPLEDVKRWAKEHGWRCIILRRQEMGNTVKKRKQA